MWSFLFFSLKEEVLYQAVPDGRCDAEGPLIKVKVAAVVRPQLARQRSTNEEESTRTLLQKVRKIFSATGLNVSHNVVAADDCRSRAS